MFNMGFPPDWSTLRKLIWLRAALLRAASAVIRLVTGSAPLILTNAVHHAIHSLTQYGRCVQDGTPTPDAPVDIVTNNGVLRYGALGRNLCDPSAANTVLEYYINKADGEVKPSQPNFLFANYMPVEPGKTYVAYGRAKSGNDLSDYNRVAWYDSTKTWISGADYTQNRIAVVTAPANAAYARFSCNPTGTTTTVVTQELVDSYNWMFAEGNAEITPFVPFVGGIVADGTPEVLTITGENLFDQSYFGVGVGTTVTYGTFNIPNGTYTFSTNFPGVKSGSAWYTNVFILAGEQTSGASTIDNGVYDGTPRTITVTDGKYTVAYRSTGTINTNDPKNYNWMLAAGSSVTDYEAYVTPQTVNDVPMLLSADTVEIVSGGVTRKVGIKVLDGTETWEQGTGTSEASFYVYSDSAISNRRIGATGTLISHFEVLSSTILGTTGKCFLGVSTQRINFTVAPALANSVTAFKQWLAAQYAAGTPVIVVYPLAEETTEQTTAHALHTSEGTIIIDVTANVSPVELACEYYATPAAGFGLGSPGGSEGEPDEDPEEEG